MDYQTNRVGSKTNALQFNCESYFLLEFQAQSTDKLPVFKISRCTVRPKTTLVVVGGGGGVGWYEILI